MTPRQGRTMRYLTDVMTCSGYGYWAAIILLCVLARKGRRLRKAEARRNRQGQS
jgi:hypothetical protein